MNKIYIKFLREMISALEGEEFKDMAHLTTKELLALQAAWLERQEEEEETIKL